jgi:GNAT superfamily N-acetyltransferase
MEDVESETKIPEPYPESDVSIWNDFFAQLNAGKMQYMGVRPFMCLDTLVTHPEYRGLGAGRALVGWGCERADGLGMESFLDSTDMGLRLYGRCGFEEVGRMGVEVGGERVGLVVSIMVSC